MSSTMTLNEFIQSVENDNGPASNSNGKVVQPELKGLDSDSPFAKLVTEIAAFVGSGTYRSCGHAYGWFVIQRTDPTKPIFHVSRVEPSGERVSVARLRLNESWSDWTNQSEPPRIFKKALAQVLRHRNQAIAAKAKGAPEPDTQEQKRVVDSMGVAASTAIRVWTACEDILKHRRGDIESILRYHRFRVSRGEPFLDDAALSLAQRVESQGA